jgi:hypothetical protein
MEEKEKEKLALLSTPVPSGGLTKASLCKPNITDLHVTGPP